METLDLGKIRARITRCLALARSATGPEAATATARAAAIAARYGIDLRSVAQDAANAAPVDAPVRQSYAPTNSSLWRASLAWKVAAYAGIEMVRSRGRDHAFFLIGRPADIATWTALYERAEGEIDAEATRYVRAMEADGYWSRSKRSDGDTFRKHAASGFGARLREQAAQAAQSTNGKVTSAALASAGVQDGGNALVLVSRALAVEAKKTAEFPTLRTIRVKSSGSSSAARDGDRFGRSMGIHRGNLDG
jgi:hypothetical protein